MEESGSPPRPTGGHAIHLSRSSHMDGRWRDRCRRIESRCGCGRGRARCGWAGATGMAMDGMAMDATREGARGRETTSRERKRWEIATNVTQI